MCGGQRNPAQKTSALDHLHTKQPEIRLADSAPQKEVPAICEKPKAPEICNQVHSKTTPAKPSTVRHVKQPDTWTPRSSAAPVMRGKEQSIRERSAVTPAHDLPPTPQVQARQSFVENQPQLSQSPSIESIYPSEPAAPILPQPPVSEAPAITPERQPVTAGSGKSAPPVQPPTPAQPHQWSSSPPSVKSRSQTPRRGNGPSAAFRYSDKGNSANQRTKGQRQKRLYQKLLQSAHEKQQRRTHSGKCSKRATTGLPEQPPQPRKKLAEAAAKAVKELISALASLGGGTALFVVFSIVIVAGAFLASPLGILFADEQESEDTVPLATAIAEIQGEYHAELERLQNGDL